VSYPIIDGLVGPDFGCVPFDVSFEDLSSYEYGIDSVLWDFGTGLDTNANDFLYTYKDTLFALVLLTVYTGAGCNVTAIIDTLGIGMHTYPDFTWPHPDVLAGEDTIKICYNEPLEFFYTGPDTSAYDWQNDPTPPTPHRWNWTNAISSQDENPNIGFNFPDTGYFVTLITNHFGCSDTIFYEIDSIIGVGPVPKFSMNPTFMCLQDKPYEVEFFNSSEFDTINSVLTWSFGDGTDTIGLDPVPHIYESPGIYLPSLNIVTIVQIEFDPDSFLTCEVTFPKLPILVEINDYELLSINANSFEFCDDGSATLLANVSTPVFPPDYTQNIWDFGDGSPGFLTYENSAIAQHFYDSAGVYNLTVIGTNGVCFDTIVVPVFVYSLPQAGFTFTDTVCAATTDSIHIFDSSDTTDLDITGWKYTYFPGGPFDGLSAQNPWIPITQAQDYFVSLQVTDEFGCKSSVFTNKINVHDIGFVVLDQNTCNNSLYEVKYDLDTNDVDYPPVTFFWEFGTGTTDTTSNPFVAFNNITDDSTFTNYLTITDSTGCPHTEEFDIDITLPQMSFSQQFDEFNCDPIDGSFVARYFFTVTSISTIIDTIIMDFGDNSSPAIIDTIENAIDWPHTYTAPGFYTVTFSVIDENGCSNTIVLENWVDVIGPHVNPYYTTQDSCPPLNVQFLAEDTVDIDSFTWFFGDGVTSNEVEPVYDYMQAGTFFPFLQVDASMVDANGDTLTCSFQYTNMPPIVIGGPLLNVGFGDPNCAGTPVNIVNNSTNPGDFAVQWQWDFGDGSDVEIQNTVDVINPIPHNYVDGGDYIVTLTALTENGTCIYISDSSVFVTPPLDLQPLDVDSGCTPLTIHFVPDQGDLINQINNPLWDFGDGGSSDLLTPTHTYTVGGQDYNVSLSYFTEGCLFDFPYPEPVSVYENPIANFDFVLNVEDNAVNSYTATNMSEGYESILWIFNGADISSDNQVTVQVGQGDNILTLIAFTENGCTDTLSSLLESVEPVNIITPNNDMINDALFFNLGESQMSCAVLNVFNRWGKLVYSAGSYTNDWKGTNNSGNDLEEGTYFYVLDICGEGAIKGYVNIVR
jgi:gliding motility-associated-like protein